MSAVHSSVLILNEYELGYVIKRKNPGERIGESAVRLNLLTPFQVNSVLYRKRKLQEPIGCYFVKNNLVSPGQIDLILSDLERHYSIHV